MPRDDLTIDFVQKMPTVDSHDPAVILDDWFNRVQNLPEEIRFMQDEIADKDRQYNELIRGIEERDGKLQKWIKTNGSHVANPKEAVLCAEIRQNYAAADQLSLEKIALTERLRLVYDKHLRNLDAQIKHLYDRGEPGFTDPDELPSLLRNSAANRTEPLIRTPVAAPASSSITAAGPGPSPLNPSHASASTVTAAPRPAAHPNVRQTQQSQQTQGSQAISAPATPAATIILNRQREGSVGPSLKRVPRSIAASGNVPAASSSLARHSSLGPGTPKGSTGAAGGAASRAGSAGPRTGSVKTASNAASRRATPTAAGRKKVANKSNLSRVRKASTRTSPTSTGDSDLSEAQSTSANDDDDDDDDGNDVGSVPENASRPKGMLAAYVRDADGDMVVGDAEDDDEGSDDKKYCLCHNVSYGDMVACDNDDCPYEWFHWSCVGLESEPNGTWYCPECAKKLDKKSSK
ncbi:hypothetical protein CDD81_5560 [Ophiocordyceps australis]|uniref:Chromatin modification-related protein n=1 Tax=Ophiocordyceps australis TaxID=1399860 RepID=A0A2C5XIC1_9HYPO|nr:hypothetical protein CDD81_5560 [Ophiocordyceps australis]